MAETTYGAWVRATRRGRGFSQKQLGKTLGIDRSTLSRWERQPDWPPLRELIRYWRLVDGEVAIDGALHAGYTRQQAILEMDTLLRAEEAPVDPVATVVDLLEGTAWHPDVGRALALLARLTARLDPTPS